MSKTIVFNPATHQMRELSDNDAQKAVDEAGYVRVGGANELVAIFHPGRNEHKTVLVQDLTAWEGKGYFASPTVVYHPEEGAQTVSAEQAKAMLSQGWFDSPAEFTKADKDAIVEKAVKAYKAAKKE